MVVADDAVVVVREEEFRGYKVLITAERVVRGEAWLVVGRVDDELHDARKSDYPEETAAQMLREIDSEYC